MVLRPNTARALQRTAAVLPAAQADGAPGSRRVPDSRGPALVGLLITLLLVLGGVLLIRELGRAARLQDCVMSGRTNCAPIDSSGSVGGP